MSCQTKGYLIALIGIAIWSATGVLIGFLVTNYAIPVLVLALWRDLLVCVILFPVLFLIRRSLLRISASQVYFFIFYGLILSVFNSIWTLSVKVNGAAVATVLAYSSAGFTAILAFWLYKDKLGPVRILAISMSLTGCVMVSNAYRAEMWLLHPVGIVAGLASGLLFAGYTLMGKEAARRQIDPWTTILYSFAFGTMFLFLFNLVPHLPGSAGSYHGFFPKLPADGWIALFSLSLGPTLFGFGLYITSMNYLPAGIVNLLATMEPAMTAVEAYVFLDERMTMIQIEGGLIILAAVVIVRFENGIRKNASVKSFPSVE
jgi:drug/metabolite transporter, DME family